MDRKFLGGLVFFNAWHYVHAIYNFGQLFIWQLGFLTITVFFFDNQVEVGYSLIHVVKQHKPG